MNSKNPSFHEAQSISKYIRKSKYVFLKRQKKQNFDFFKSMLLNDLFEDTVPPQLLSSDQISMFYSIENRSPFLSKNILVDTMRFPTDYFIRNGFTKSLLRDAFKDLLPKKIVNFIIFTQ